MDEKAKAEVVQALKAGRATVFGCIEWPPPKHQQDYPGGYDKGRCVACDAEIVVSRLNLKRAQAVGNVVFIMCRACAVLAMALLGEKAKFGGVISEGRLPRDDHN